MNRGLGVAALIVAGIAVLSFGIAVTACNGYARGCSSTQQIAATVMLILAGVACGLFCGAVAAGPSAGKFLPFRIVHVWLASLRHWAERKERELGRKD